MNNTISKIANDIRVAAYFNAELRLCLYNIAQECLRGANDLSDPITQDMLGKLFQEHTFRLRCTYKLHSDEETSYDDWFGILMEMSETPIKGLKR